MPAVIPEVGDIIKLTATEDDPVTKHRKKGWSLSTVVLTVCGQDQTRWNFEVLGGELLHAMILTFYQQGNSDKWKPGGIGDRPPFRLEVVGKIGILPIKDLLRVISR